MMSEKQIINLIGKRFGRLIVIKRMQQDRWRNYKWLCQCDCGKQKIVRSGSLRSGYTQSCGCLQKERCAVSHTRHGHKTKEKTSKIYRIWEAILRRCKNPNYHEYKYYGGRGIKVCERWKKFENFLTDMGKPPTKNHSIDRINNDKDYCLENCRWATKKEQQRNKRNNHLETFNEKTKCIAEWAEEFGIPDGTLRARLKYGWSIDRALTTPVKARGKL